MNAKKRIRVFVSYSHNDQEWLERLKVHLKPLAKDYEIDVWEDTKIKPGSKWREEISKAVSSANVAVLLISADFLASEFISNNELPPLLKAAEEEGAIILPVIISPSLFTYSIDLAQFQAINDPSKPVIMMSKGEQERVFLKIAEVIYQNAQERRSQTEDSLSHRNDAKRESFLDPYYWNRLIKIGDWIYDEHAARIIGSGVFCYLLSRNEYGKKPYTISAKLQFSNIAQHLGHQSSEMMNSGIVLGWNSDKSNPRYYNILLTGRQLLLERIGFKGGDAYRDFDHIDNGRNFDVEENKTYSFTISFTGESIDVFLDEHLFYSFRKPRGILGRVGLRPWRSQLDCFHFSVSEVS